MNSKETEIELVLTEELRTLIRQHPTAIHDMIDETKQSAALLYFNNIIQAQITKAVAGDTSAAKFMVEFMQPAELVPPNIEESMWSDKAIAIRDELGLEVSAEILVNLILNKLSANDVRKLLA